MIHLSKEEVRARFVEWRNMKKLHTGARRTIEEQKETIRELESTIDDLTARAQDAETTLKDKEETIQQLQKLLFERPPNAAAPHTRDHTTDRTNTAYDAIVQAIRDASRVHCDETGWPIDGAGWAHVFTTPNEALYLCHDTRGKGVAERALGPDLGGGVRNSDCVPTDVRQLD